MPQQRNASSRATALMPKQQSPAEVDVFGEFIERMGLSAQGDGLPRIAGRMMAWFVLNGGPICLTDLAAALQISKASASTNARLLAGLGVLQRASASEGRKDFYVLASDAYSRLLEGYVERMSQRLDMLDKLIPAIPGTRPDVKQRVATMHEFYADAVSVTNGLIERLREPKS